MLARKKRAMEGGGGEGGRLIGTLAAFYAKPRNALAIAARCFPTLIVRAGIKSNPENWTVSRFLFRCP